MAFVPDDDLPVGFGNNPKVVPQDDLPGAKDRSYIGASASSGWNTLKAAGAKILEEINPFTTSEEDLAVLYKNDPSKLKDITEKSAATVLSRYAQEQTARAASAMQEVDPSAKGAISGKPLSDLEYATLDPEKAAYLSPTRIAGDVLQSLPTTLALGVSAYLTKGRSLAAYEEASAAALAKGLAKSEADQLAKAAAMKVGAETMAKTGAVGEGVVGYAQQSNQTLSDAKALSDDKWAESSDYKSLLDNGYSPDAAKMLLSNKAAERSGILAGAIDAGTNLVGGRILGKVIGEGGSLIPRVAKGFAGESATEFVQSGGEQFASNLALQQIDPTQSLSSGVLESAVAGGVVGGVTGGGFAGVLGSRQREVTTGDVLKSPTVDTAIDAAVQAADLDLKTSLVPELASDIDAYNAASLRSPALNPSDALELAAAKGAMDRVGSLDLSQPAPIAAPASAVNEAGDSAARAVEAAGGVATPAQAAMLDRAFPGQKMYDQVVGSSEQVPTVSNNSPIIIEPGRAPREVVSFANPLEAENAEGWKRFAANQKQAAQTVANEATSVANQAPQVNVNNVISALQTTPGLQTAEQRVTLNAARQNLSPEDFQILETAAVNRGNLSAEQQIRLRFMEKQGVSPQNQEAPVLQENQATLSTQRTDEQETQLPQAELVYSPTKMGEGYRLVGTQNVNGREMLVYADESVTPTAAPSNTQFNQPSVPEMGTNVPNMGTTEQATETFTPKQGVATLESTATGNDEVGSTGTVNSDGKAYQYTVVESGVAPGVSGAIRQLARLFGKKVVFFNSDLAADGFVQPGKGSAIYINANSKMSPMAVFGHELMHLLKRDNPIAYKAVAAVVGRNLKGDAASNFRDYYNAAGPNQNSELTDAEMEEMVADLMGNEFTQESFLSDVFNEISQIVPEGQARSIILRLAATINKAVKAALNVIKGMPVSQAFQTEQMVNNLEQIRASLKSALKEYAIQQKESAAKMAMEFTRETSLIQLSPSRENTTPNQNVNQSTADRMDLGATLQNQGAENAAENDTGRIRSVQQNPGENRPGSVGDGRDQNDQIPSFGTDGGRAGSIRVQGVHYSKGQLSHVDGNFYGSNVSRSNGAEAERVRLARDRRITKRGYFYINTGNGIKPEANVGSVPHTAYLNNLYDTATGLITAADENSFESAVLDAGFDGFINRSVGMAVVLDNKQVPVVPSDGTAEVVPAADKTTSVRAELSSIKSLPSGELTRERWGQVLKAARPDLHEKIEPTGAFNGEERVYKDGLVKFSPPREYKMELAKEDRAISKAAGLTQEETAMVKAEAKKLGLTNVRTEELLTAARETKKQYPQSAGWAPIKLVGLKANTNEDTGETTVDLKWQEDAYAFNRAPGVNRAPPKMDRAWADKVAKSFYNLIKDIYDRAAAGDKNAQIIVSHQTWYRNVAEVLRREYGGFGDLLADLLGATSPNTPVDTNWKFSIDAMRRFVRGDFNAELERFDQFVKDGGRVSDFPSADKIRQASGKLYGMNSDKAMKAMLDMWRILEKGSAPKARNFALNLIGQSNMATIDVWAARMIRRAANLVRGAKYPRIPPPAEKGVTGEWNASTTGVTGEFGFGAYVMDLVSEMLAKEGINVTPPDLQAIAWFAEKELWGTNRWTTVTGEGGSFEENIDAMPVERFMAGWSIQQGEKVPDEGDASIVQVRVGSVLSGDESVVAFRVMPSHGLYGNTVEQSFDTEWTVLKGEHDPSLVMAEIARIARDYDQFDIFVSRVIAADDNNPNARPGVEVYFKNKRALDQAMPILERFTAKGQDGFTMVVDPRSKTPGEYIGVRLQYVPEISMRWDEELRKTLLEPGGIESEIDSKRYALQDIVSELAEVDGVAYAKVFNYDTVVVGKENYDAYIDRAVAGGYSQAGSEVWFGQPIRQGLERAVARYERNDGQVGGGGVSDVSLSKVRDSAQEVKLSPPRFYSQLERTIEQVPERLQTQPAAQWKAWLASNSAKFGIKKDEIEWSGINNYLDLRGKDKVTADEIRQFLNLNNVKITEVVKGEPEGAFLRMPGGAEYGDNSGTKYGQYTLPGGANYREMLLTLPQKERLPFFEWSDRKRETTGIGDAVIDDDTLDQWEAEYKQEQKDAKTSEYRSGHWGEANVLAHIRMNDRTDANGNKVLFVEEIQSDWAQAGRKLGFGYKDNAPLTPEEDRELMDLYGMRAYARTDAQTARMNELNNRLNASQGKAGIPDAPFVKNTKDWVALAVKRVMLLAAQGNYDKVAFVNGQQSADRYDLSKQVEAIRVNLYLDGTYGLGIKPIGKNMQRYDTDIPADKLESVIGKELAAKVQSEVTEPGIDNGKVFSGIDLQVGGEGMKSFYDRIVPQVVGDVLKKLGEKPGTVTLGLPPAMKASGLSMREIRELGGMDQPGFTVTPEMRDKLQGEGLPLFSRQRTIEVDGVSRPTENSNGQPIAKSEEAIRNFWRWYDAAGVPGVLRQDAADLQDGGRLSQSNSSNAGGFSADEGGRPINLYHGTAGTFEEFQVGHPDQKDLGWLGRGIYLTNSRDMAEAYAGIKARRTKKEPVVMQLYAAIKNPFVLTLNEKNILSGYPLERLVAFTDNLKKSGYDGVALDYGNGETELVAFEPNQVKSATDNAGTFSAESDNIKFSRSRIADAVAGVTLKSEIANQVKFKLADIIAPGNGFNWFHKTVGTQFHKAKINPLFKKVFDLGQQFLDDVTLFATRAEDKAADIFPRFGLSKSLLKTGLSKSDNQLIAWALTDGTLENGADPHTGVVWSDEELRSKYGMNDNQIGYYRQARAALDQSLDDLAKSEMATHMRIAMKANITPLIRADISLGDVRDMLIQSLDAGISSTTNEDAVKMLQKTKSQINGIYSTTTNLKNHGYAPLMRFGNYTVTAYDENGDVAFFQMTDTKSEASLMAKNLEGEFDRIETGKMSAEAHKLFKGITPDTLELFAKHTALGNDALTQEYLQLAVSSRSAMKRLINRKGTTGYSLDATRTLATFLASNARKSSSALNMYDMKQAADAIPREEGDVKDEAIKLVEYLQNPGEEAAKLRGFLFFQYLGGSIASGIVNLTQPILQTYPYLSQFGTGQAASAMKTGTVAATHFLRGKRVGDPSLQAALEKAKAEGLIDPQEIYQLMAASQSGSGSFLSYKLMRLWGINFGVTEIMNRTVTFAAAFKVGQSLSKEELAKAGAKDAYSFAQGAIYETQGLYNKGNRPDWARGAVGGTIFTFKQYSISYLEFMTRLYKNDKKAFGIALAILVMASGLQGLPGADDLDDVIDTAGNWMGYATNAKKWKREFLEDVFSKEMAAFALHGVSTIPGMPIDVQARLGLGNIIPGTGLLNPTKKDKGREVAEVFGVAGGMAMSTMDTAEALARGDVRRAALAILPGAVRNLIQASEMAATGEYRDTRGRLVQKVDGGDVIAKAIGFQPAEIAAGNRRMREVQADIDIVKAKQEEVNGKYARAIVDKDQGAMAEVRAEMQDWNQKNPDLRIKFNMSAIQQRVKQAKLTKEARFIKSAPQQIRQQVREAVLAD